jgi:D-glycero-D-manno-heptose 1,7-bisphosphate phosphatase
MIEQAVILCGGMGTRLGALTTATPKPLLPVGDTPFLQILIQEIARCGVRKFLLLAGHLSEQIERFAHEITASLNGAIEVDVAVERKPAGTGGALHEARDRLAEQFLLVNGDSFLDVALNKLGHLLNSRSDAVGAIALRHVSDSGRYGAVGTDGQTIIRFREKQPDGGPGLINGGIYLLRRAVLDFVTPNCSLERDVLPALAAQGRLLGYQVDDGFFIDIGLPETYHQAQRDLIRHRRRPAVFMDRDGVLNLDAGHVGTVDRFMWTPGAIDAIRLLNDKGFYVFVATNQAGIAKAKYDIDAYWHLRDHIRADLFAQGAQIDDERFCPYHPDAVDSRWRGPSDWRKPEPGMLLDLMRAWPIEASASFMIGDKPTDLAAARAAGINGYHFVGGNLRDFVWACLQQQNEKGRGIS